MLAYLNNWILALMAAAEGDPGVCIMVSFQYLINELNHGRYTGNALPRTLQELLTVRAGRRAVQALAAALPLPAPQTIDVDSRSGGRGNGGGGEIAPRRQRQNDRDGDVISNPRPFQRLHILSGENRRGMRRDVALPTLGSVAFCKRWHMEYTCFGYFLRAASHLHPVGDIVDEVAAAMAADRAARAANEVPT